METKEKFRFRLLGGNHVEPNPDPNAGPDENNEKGIQFNKGDIIVTTRPLDKIFPNKFERIYSDEQLKVREVVVTEKPPVPAPETVIQPKPDTRTLADNVPTEIPETPEIPNVE